MGAAIVPYERLLQTTILPDLEAGRPNWDQPHTLAVVSYIKDIIANNPDLKLDRDVLVIAAYAHDWGYVGSLAKEEHLKIGAIKISGLLQNKLFDFLSAKQKKRVVHLVRVHDKLDAITATDERILVEADTLGALDVTKTKPTFDKAANDKYIQSTRERRLPLFITEYGKQRFEKLILERQAYYNEEDNQQA